MEREILKKAAAWFARESRSIPGGVRVREGEPGRVARRGNVPHHGALPQRVPWLKRPPSARPVANAELVDRMRAIYAFSRETYGGTRMLAELRDEGLVVSHKRVERLMREHGLVDATRWKKWRTTKRTRTPARFPTSSSGTPRLRAIPSLGG